MDSKRSWCIFVIVREEYFFLPKWYQYYSRFLDDQDIYIVHHVPDPENSKDTSTDFLKGKCQIFQETHDSVDGNWLIAINKKYQAMLLEKYQAVAHTDVDEIIFVDPRPEFKDLGQMMDKFLASDQESMITKTFTLMHQPNIEPKIDLTRNILPQRHFWYRDRWYDKSLITKKVQNSNNGHHIYGQYETTPGLLMLHLHQYDFDEYVNRHIYWAKNYKFADEDIKHQRNYHYRRVGEKLTHQYLHHYSMGISEKRIFATRVPPFVNSQIQL